MKWIKVAIGAVIAIVMVGFIVTSLHSMTRGTTVIKEVEFTVHANESTYTPFNTFVYIELYSVIDGANFVTNIQSLKLNDIDETLDSYIILESKDFSIYINSFDGADVFRDDGTYIVEDGVFQDGDVLSITFEVPQPPQLTGVIATLLLLTPLIIAGGVLAYMLNKQEFLGGKEL